MQKITPFLWFDNQAEEAVDYYVSIFRNSKIVNVARYGEDGAKVSGRPQGTVMTVVFQIDGQQFIALHGGPVFTFSPAISYVVNCDTQDEVDRLRDRLSAGGEQQQCGWLKDRYGMSWQIVPTVLGGCLSLDRNILRLAMFEILFAKETPRKVAINEAIELAKSFGSDSSPRLIN